MDTREKVKQRVGSYSIKKRVYGVYADYEGPDGEILRPESTGGLHFRSGAEKATREFTHVVIEGEPGTTTPRRTVS